MDGTGREVTSRKDKNGKNDKSDEDTLTEETDIAIHQNKSDSAEKNTGSECSNNLSDATLAEATVVSDGSADKTEKYCTAESTRIKCKAKDVAEKTIGSSTDHDTDSDGTNVVTGEAYKKIENSNCAVSGENKNSKNILSDEDKTEKESGVVTSKSEDKKNGNKHVPTEGSTEEVMVPVVKRERKVICTTAKENEDTAVSDNDDSTEVEAVPGDEDDDDDDDATDVEYYEQSYKG